MVGVDLGNLALLVLLIFVEWAQQVRDTRVQLEVVVVVPKEGE